MGARARVRSVAQGKRTGVAQHPALAAAAASARRARPPPPPEGTMTAGGGSMYRKGQDPSTKMLRSSFGAQPTSTRDSSPAFGFGSSTREVGLKVRPSGGK